MCEPRAVAAFRDPARRERAAVLKADGLTLKQIGTALGVSATTAQAMLLPMPPLEPEPPRPRVCRHCGRGTVCRPRGLCWPCYYSPGVRERYTSGSRYARRGVPARRGNRPLPKPTAAAPGSAGKLVVLIERAAAGQRLWHPADGRC